jgi:hypothetical protein
MNSYLRNARKATRTFAEHGRRRRRWIALSVVIALTVGAWGMPIAQAVVTSGNKAVFVAVSPKRVLDTRVNVGLSGKFSTGVPRLLKITGNVPIAPSGTATVVPAGALAVVLNVTVVNPSKAGYLSVRPGDATGSPSTSSLNFLAGVTIPNEVTIGLPTAGGNAGKIQIWYQANHAPGTTDVLVDVVGYYDHHRHDDRYYTKAQVKKMVFDQRAFVGSVAGSDGTKRDSGVYTPSRTGTGAYNVTFNTVGLGIASAQMPPNITATPSYFCAAGSTAAADWSLYYTTTEVEYFIVTIKTYNSAAAAADCDFQFHIDFAAPPSLGIPEPAMPDVVGEQSPAGTPIKCRNEPTGPVCEPAG